MDSLEGRGKGQEARERVARAETKVLWVLMGLLGLSTGLNFLLGYLAFSPNNHYFLEGADGRLTEIKPLDRPTHSRHNVASFARDCVESAFSYDFKNFRKQLQGNENCFTPDGFGGYLEGFDASKNLERVRKNSLIATAMATGPAVVVKEGLDRRRGAYIWDVQVPIAISYESASERYVQNVVADVRVSRVSERERRNGMGIQYVTLGPASNG